MPPVSEPAPAPTPRRKYQPRNTEVVPRKKLSVRRLTVLSVEAPAQFYWRPKTREDCDRVPRPCPYVGCKHHLFLDVRSNGNIRLNFPDSEPEDLAESCSLDVADEGSHSLDMTMGYLNVTRERVRQIERVGMWRMLEDETLFDIAMEMEDGVELTNEEKRKEFDLDSWLYDEDGVDIEEGDDDG